jgi:hypothetical protein
MPAGVTCAADPNLSTGGSIGFKSEDCQQSPGWFPQMPAAIYASAQSDAIHLILTFPEALPVHNSNDKVLTSIPSVIATFF